jgi:predicted dehydrogenase
VKFSRKGALSSGRQGNTPVSRRYFVKTAAAAAVAPAIGVHLVGGEAPTDVLRVAAVGVGNRGWSDLVGVSASPNVRITALCDVDAVLLAKATERFPAAKAYRDYRRLFDEASEAFDAVVVATPDHMHAAITSAAMRLGKHVYVEKPLAHNLHEVRALARLADDCGVVTQMGVQIHNHTAYRTAVEIARRGVLGRVTSAHVWVASPWLGPNGSPPHTDPVPEGMDWDLWLGVAAERPYTSGLYHPLCWRAWRDFGTGTLGDMGCHLLDPLFTALEVHNVKSVVSRGPMHSRQLYATDMDVSYRMEGSSLTAEEFLLSWTCGSSPRVGPDFRLPANIDLPPSGSIWVGERATMILPHWSQPTVFIDETPIDHGVTPLDSRDHFVEWINACQGVGATSVPISVAAPLTEAVLVGVVACGFPNRELTWNSPALRFDHQEATRLVERSYRSGWRPDGI